MAESPPPPASSPLLIRSPGSVVVASDELLSYLAELSGMAHELREVGAGLGALLRAAWLPLGGRPSVDSIHDARLRVGDAADCASALARAVETAVRNYSEAEAAAEREQQALAGGLASSAMPALVLIGLLALGVAPTALGALGAVALVGRLSGTDPLGDLQRRLLGDPRLLTNPATVRSVELAVASGDELGAAAAGVPGPVAAILSERGITGADTAAAGAIVAGSAVGLLRETPVRLAGARVSTDDRAPAGVEERLARIPEGEQIRIERYDAEGMPPRFQVYLGPTESFSPVADGEPWDMTSNVSAIAGLPAGSLRATELAMAEAGIGPDDEVQFVGYSQGGLVAARLAGSEQWNTVGLETFGAPTGSVPLPPDVHGLAVRHTDDLVPALGGPHAGSGQLQVERQAYPAGTSIPTDEPLPAHLRSNYAATAHAIDRAASPQLRAEVDRLDAFAADYSALPGSTVTTYVFRAERSATSGGP